MSEFDRWRKLEQFGWVSDEDDVALLTEARMLDEIERLRGLVADSPIFPFLMGEAALHLPDGGRAWFGEPVTPPFWWRRQLRVLLAEILDGAK